MKLVYIASNHCDVTPYTTPEIIAEVMQCDNSIIKDFIQRNYRAFHKLATDPKSIYLERYDHNHLNEAQTMFLFSRTKKDEDVIALRNELIRQFDSMTDELNVRKAQRELFYAARQERTDLMRALGIKSSLHGQYAELAYISAFDQSTSAVRYKNDVPKYAQTVDFLTAEELVALTQAQQDITKYLSNGYSYEQIKALVAKQPAADKGVSIAGDILGADISVLVWKYVAEHIRPYL